jgi:uncharacterized membrane protein
MTVGILLLILIGTWMGTIASVFFKKASGSSGFKALLTNKYLWIGGMIYVGSAVLNIIVLRYLDYSVVLPLTSITYIWTMLVSFLVLKEHISIKQIIGVSLIVVGAVLIAR